MPARPSPVPPRLVISEPVEREANTPATRRRGAGPSPAYNEVGRNNTEWEDVEEEPSRRRRRSRRTASGGGKSQISAEKQAESEFGRFFPKLSRILETTESNVSSRPGTRGSDRSRQGDRSSRRPRRRDYTSSIYSRSPRQKSGGVQRRTSSGYKINPSLLSVLSGLTSTSDRSSGSNSTITQRSYNRRGSGETSKTPPARPRRAIMESESAVSSVAPARSPNVFDYMQTSSVGDSYDRRSTISSSSSVSSHYQHSDAGSSEAPGTPSSRSTISSPTATRRGSVAELRRKYDQHYAASISSRGSSPRSSIRSLRKQPSVSDVLEDEDEEDDEEEEEDESVVSQPVAPSELDYDTAHKHSSFQHDDESGRDQHHRQHAEQIHQPTPYKGQHYQPHHQYNNPYYPEHRSGSMSSDQAQAYPHHMALEHYHYPTPPAAPSPPAAAPPSPYPPTSTSPYVQPSHLTHPPPAPDAPDLRKRTIAGYELLALELTSSSQTSNNSTLVKPLYRKFEYLHHRILLHLQDELAEMEAHLRTLDEIIAQLSNSHSVSPETKYPPASRRAETYSGSRIHAERTALLGRIFQKTEQYHAALRNRNEALKDAVPATESEVEAYKAFLATERPLVDAEAEFLQHKDDLVHPAGTPRRERREPGVAREAGLYVPLLLAVPLLLFSLIPGFAGRVAVTVLVGAGAAVVAAATSAAALLSGREWALCACVYALVMLGVAGCVPAR